MVDDFLADPGSRIQSEGQLHSLHIRFPVLLGVHGAHRVGIFRIDGLFRGAENDHFVVRQTLHPLGAVDALRIADSGNRRTHKQQGFPFLRRVLAQGLVAGQADLADGIGGADVGRRDDIFVPAVDGHRDHHIGIVRQRLGDFAAPARLCRFFDSFRLDIGFRRLRKLPALGAEQLPDAEEIGSIGTDGQRKDQAGRQNQRQQLPVRKAGLPGLRNGVKLRLLDVFRMNKAQGFE